MKLEDLRARHQAIQPFIRNTYVMYSSQINSMTGADIVFKCENFQRMGAFKMRGATNAMLQLTDEERSRGVVTHSSGNFAQAVSLAAKLQGIKAYIVMPENAPSVKKEAVRGYGGHITECESTPEAREAMAEKIRVETGASFLHPSDDYHVIVGQGTAALELLDSNPGLDLVVTPVGGGGLIAGTCLSVQAVNPGIHVVGAEPFEVDDAYRSLQSGRIEYNKSTNTIADGLRTHLGDVNFPIIKEFVKDIVRVSEETIISSMKLIYERMKIVVEPSSAVALAAIFTEPELFRGKKLGIILSGGNVDLKNLPF